MNPIQSRKVSAKYPPTPVIGDSTLSTGFLGSGSIHHPTQMPQDHFTVPFFTDYKGSCLLTPAVSFLLPSSLNGSQ